jgi:Luciferase-like monooxygenase
MQFGIHLPIFGPYGDALRLAYLAAEAEEAGWDGFFLWDAVANAFPLPLVDPWVALTAIALNTKRIRLGPLVTPLSRRRPWKVAREAVSLDHLSHGRLILGVGSGGDPEEFDDLGEARDPKIRAAMLEEGLEVLINLWSGETFTFEGSYYHIHAAQFLPRPLQSPRIPIWVGGSWPLKAPFRRAARWDGVYPKDRRLREEEMMEVQEVQHMRSYLDMYREPGSPFDVVHAGITSGENLEDAQTVVARYEAVGVTWWLENIIPQRWGGSWTDWRSEEMHRRITQGPPRLL